jgi:hypothetical protein
VPFALAHADCGPSELPDNARPVSRPQLLYLCELAVDPVSSLAGRFDGCAVEQQIAQHATQLYPRGY